MVMRVTVIQVAINERNREALVVEVKRAKN